MGVNVKKNLIVYKKLQMGIVNIYVIQRIVEFIKKYDIANI